jgi:polygalacturonase
MTSRRFGATLTIGLAFSHIAFAQDRRTVTEPVVPPSCTTLAAALKTSNHSLVEADEDKLDTDRLQKALDHCGKGKALKLAKDGANDAFLTGPFSIPAGVTLLVDRGVTLFASRDPRLYDLHPGSCGLVSKENQGCHVFITAKGAPHASIMGEGSIDGRGGSKILHGNESWWDLAADARSGGRQQVPRMLDIADSDDFTLYNITLRNSANFHVLYHGGKGFTVWGLKIDTPRTARNTDGIDPSGSSDITITKSFIRTGDDNIAIKGSSGSGVTHMSVVDNHFYYGHGMSIGSETYDGVSDLLVSNLTLDGTDSGIRIKSNATKGGLVDRATYSDICIRDSKNPIFIDTDYVGTSAHTGRLPEYKNLLLKNVQIGGGGKVFVGGLDDQHRTTITLDGVLLDEPSRYKISAEHAAVTYGPGPVNFTLSGPDVSGAGKRSDGKLPSCQNRFVPFPSQAQ